LAITVLALAACQGANRVVLLHDVAAAPPRVFQWTLVLETAEMSDGAMLPGGEAWVVGPYGTILHTTNGGASQDDWDAVESNTTSQLGAITAVQTPGGSFALVTGVAVALRYSSEYPIWEPVDINPAPGKRPSLHVTEDGHVSAWLTTLDGFAYASDARTGSFAKITMPPGATEVVFAEDGDSWTIAPIGPECVPYRKAHNEVDWHPVPIPPHAPTPHQLRQLSTRLVGLYTGANLQRSFSGFSATQVCADARLLVTKQRKKLWFATNDGLSEWDGHAWASYDYPANIAAALAAAPPPGGVPDITDDGAEFVLFPARTPPTLYPVGPPANAEETLRRDPHALALAAWKAARATRFSVADLWMRDRQIWAVGREGFVHSTDGGRTWTITPAPDPAAQAPALRRPAGANRRGQPGGAGKVPAGMSLRTVSLNERATQGWAVADDGQVFHYDGAWRPQLELKIGAMQRALDLDLTDDGNVAWLLTRDTLYRITTAGWTVALHDERQPLETLLVCPDGRSGWVRHGGYLWYAYDGAAWARTTTRPPATCVSDSCAAAISQADPGNVACAAGDQLWSLSQGQTANGTIWQYPIPGLEALQGQASELRTDSTTVPSRMIVVGQDGTLLRADRHTDQPSITAPQATSDGAQVVLSWALSGPSPDEPTWEIEYCVVYSDGVCARDSAAWIADSDIQQDVAHGRYLATVDPSKLSLKADTKVQYRIVVALGELRRKPMLVAQVTLGESVAASVWAGGRLYLAGAALWCLGLLALWLVAPHALLHINDSTQQALSRVPVLGTALGSVAGVALARKLVRTQRVVTSWIRRELPPPGAGDATRHTAPAGFHSISDADLRNTFQAMATCQRAWIARHLERAVKTFEGSSFARERRAYGEVRASVLVVDAARELPKGVGLEDMRELVSPVAADPKLVLWIRGQGGVGKSHLACRVARWLAKQALLPQPAIVVILDGNAETREALDAMIRERLEALTQATDINGDLITNLLASGSVVLLFDGLTERSPRTMETIKAYLESPQAPALTLCTARSQHSFTARRSITIEPMPLDASELLPFLSSYRLSLSQDARRSEDLLEPVRKAAKRLADGERRTLLTPLLVTLIWEEAVSGAPLSSFAVEAFNGYVVRALVPAADAADVAEQRRLALVRARLLGRLALGKNYRPGRWFTRDAAANHLQDASVGSAPHDVLHDFTAAGLLEEDSSGGGQLRFLIDPLSEHLCALCILYSYDGNDPDWAKFLATLDVLSTEARAAADGFLIALADCWAAYGATLQLTSAPNVTDVSRATLTTIS